MLAFRLKILSLIILFFFSFKSSAQSDTDSLRNSIKELPENNAKAKALLSLGEKLYQRGKADEAIPFLYESRAIFKKEMNDKGEGETWLIDGHIHIFRNELDTALHHFEKARTCFEKSSYDSGLIRCYTYEGQAYDVLSKYQLAIASLSKALYLATNQKSADNQTLANINSSLGVTYFNKGSYEIAIEHYFKALQFAELTDNKRILGGILNNLGAVQVRIGNYDQALDNFLKLLAIAKELNNTPATALALSNAGECLTQTGDYKKARSLLEEAIAIRTKMEDKRGLVYTLCNMGDLFRRTGDYSASLDQYRQAVDFARPTNERELLLNPLAGLITVNLDLQKTGAANDLLNEARVIAGKIGSKLWMEKLFLLSAKSDSLIGNFKGALSWHKKYSSLHDSLFNQQKSLQIEEMKAQYETEKKDKEIQILNEIKKRQQLKQESDERLYFVSAGIFIIALICLVFWLLAKMRTEKILEAQKKEVSLANEEMRLLIQKIEDQNETLELKNDKLEDLHREKDGMVGIVAHDLRSPLNKVAGLAELISLTGQTNDEQKAMIGRIKKVCEDGNSFIRDLMELHQVEVEGDTSAVQTFDIKIMLRGWLENYSSQLEKKNLTLKTDFESDSPLYITAELFYVTRVLDNLLTNAIKFSPPGKNIYFTLWNGVEDIRLTVRDEGPGFRPEDMPHLFKKFKKLSARPTGGEHSTGLGLSIIKVLIAKLNGTIEVQSFPGEGATFIISLPRQAVSHPINGINSPIKEIQIA
jgi:signal transduction histidine kinase